MLLNIDKFINSYIKGLKLISEYKTVTLKEKKIFNFVIEGEKSKQVYNIGCVIPNCPDDILEKWSKINCMLNILYQKDKKIGDMLDTELDKLDNI